MTVTYDPSHPRYADDADFRGELGRVFDLCHGCRLCFSLCPSFPTLFAFIDDRDGAVDQLTRAEQDQVVDECYQCKLCYNKCPYVPPHEWQLDFPRLMMRAHAVRHENDRSVATTLTDQALNRTDMIGTMSVPFAGIVNATITKPGTPLRKVMEKVVGIAAHRRLPAYARHRFTTWFARRNRPIMRKRQGSVAVFPTCFIEYMEPSIGQDLVKVFERNGVACTVPAGARCCGAPWLHSGDVTRFTAQAKRNVEALAAEVADGKDVVVAQPTCAYVVKKDYPLYVKGEDAEEVAAHTYDACEYLMKLHAAPDSELDTDFAGEVPTDVTYHVACHLQALNNGLKARDLMKLAGTKVALVQKCSGIDGTWGYRAKNFELAKKVAAPMAEAIRAAMGGTDGGEGTVMGDCHLANTAIAEETGCTPSHPVQLLARAYGIPPERDA